MQNAERLEKNSQPLYYPALRIFWAGTPAEL
jgi:hypothetical protein